MDITPPDIARRTFTLVRRGFDPQEVTPFLEAVASQLATQQQQVTRALEEVASMRNSLDEARSTEEALRMTMVAATQVKEEMVRKATAEAEELVSSARAEANQLRRDANAEAEHAVSAARRDALELIEESRREARDLVVAAREENKGLVDRLDVLRRAVRELEAALRAAADIAGDRLAGAAEKLTALESIGRVSPPPPDEPDRRDTPRRYDGSFERRPEPPAGHVSFEVDGAREKVAAERWPVVTELRELNG